MTGCACAPCAAMTRLDLIGCDSAYSAAHKFCVRCTLLNYWKVSIGEQLCHELGQVQLIVTTPYSTNLAIYGAGGKLLGLHCQDAATAVSYPDSRDPIRQGTPGSPCNRYGGLAAAFHYAPTICHQLGTNGMQRHASTQVCLICKMTFLHTTHVSERALCTVRHLDKWPLAQNQDQGTCQAMSWPVRWGVHVHWQATLQHHARPRFLPQRCLCARGQQDA